MAETARLMSLGFSDDGRHYAFVEHGIQDGSGLPYVNLFIVDVDNDAWVPGTPIRQRLGEDQIPALEQGDAEQALVDLRQGVIAEATPLLGQYGISGERPGLTIAARGAYEPLTDKVTFALVTGQSGAATYDLSLDQQAFPEGEDRCYGFGTPALMSLTLEGGSLSHTLTADTGLPESRGCPLDYGIVRVLAPDIAFNGPQRLVVILAMSTPGFEGRDISYLAVGAAVPGMSAF
jgi:predicted secreted protein